MASFLRTMTASFAGRILAALFIAICLLFGVGPDKWAAFMVSGLPDFITPVIARGTAVGLAVIVIALLVISLRRRGPLLNTATVARKDDARKQFEHEQTSGNPELGHDDLITAVIKEKQLKGFRIAAGLEINPNALRIEVGEAGPFFSTGGGSLYRIQRTFNIKIENIDKHRPVSGCKVYLTKIEPQTEYQGPWLLREGFTLAAGDHLFIPLVTYGEARDQATFPCGDTFMLVRAPAPSPKPSSTGKHVFELRATSLETAPFQFRCKIWVNEAGRLRIERES